MEIKKDSFQPDLLKRDIPSGCKVLEIQLNMDINRSGSQFDLNDFIQIENLEHFVFDWIQKEGIDKYFPVFNFTGINKMNLINLTCFID